MVAIPRPSAFEARCNATYEALMWALARPGLIRTLPVPGPEAIVEALIDRECAVHCADPDLASLAERTGAALVGPEAADHVFAGRLEHADTLGRLRCGTDLHPEDGATLFVAARLGAGERLRLTGPGVDGAEEIAVEGLPEGVWQARRAAMRAPMGFELFVLDGDRVLGVPRSTTVEAL